MHEPPEYWVAPILQPGRNLPWVAKGGFIPVVRDREGYLRLTADLIGQERAMYAIGTAAHFTVETKYPDRKKSFDLQQILATRTKQLPRFIERISRNAKSPRPGSPAKAEMLHSELALVWERMSGEMSRNSLPWLTQRGAHRPLNLGLIDDAIYRGMLEEVPDPTPQLLDQARPSGAPMLDYLSAKGMHLRASFGSLLASTDAPQQEDWLGNRRLEFMLVAHAFGGFDTELGDPALLQSQMSRWLESRRVLRALQEQGMSLEPLSDNDLGMNASTAAPNPEDISGVYEASPATPMPGPH